MAAPYPILYSFRRCPYAMRARLGLMHSGVVCELREVVLRDKPSQMIELSAKATVPVLQTIAGQVIDESLDIMLWALRQNDPGGWLTPQQGTLNEALALISQNDGDFKAHLDRYKYSGRYEDVEALHHRTQAEAFLKDLDERLNQSPYLFGDRLCIADRAIAPFVRQFAHVDKAWFDQTPYTGLKRWLEAFLSSAEFASIMIKYPPWSSGDDPVWFGRNTS